MLSVTIAAAYLASCLLEGTNFSEERGTEYPFERIGASWVDSKLNCYDLKGVGFHSISYLPSRIVDCIEIWLSKFVDE